MYITATCPRGLEDLLRGEMEACGITQIDATQAALSAETDYKRALKLCLWSRIASRVVVTLGEFAAADEAELYAGMQTIDWPAQFDTDASLAIDVTLRRSQLDHSRFAAQRAKDAIVDQYRKQGLERPNIDLRNPDIRLLLFIDGDQASISLNLAGRGLHQRGYRLESVAAPLRENLAAALLLRIGWPKIAAEGGALLDPMCGSGTLLIEAAWMAADFAPGLLSKHWGFGHWKSHQSAPWQELLEDARERAAKGLANLPPIFGGDRDSQAISASRVNIRAAGLDAHIQLQRCDSNQWRMTDIAPKDQTLKPGLIICNPPYGERLSENTALAPLYQELGEMLAREFSGWQAGILTSEEQLARATELRSDRHWAIDNGPLPCRLYRFPLTPKQNANTATPPDLLNRLQKNLRLRVKWAERENVNCYRLYDADLPDYASAIDVYRTEAGQLHAVIAEYQAPKTIDPQAAHSRLRATLRTVRDLLDLPAERVHLKRRRRQRDKQQYEKLADRGTPLIVIEDSLRLEVDLEAYLDTGLFLDHRPIRQRIRKLARNKHVLNLFGYTGTATVYAAAGGAASTTTIDSSNTYLNWADRNLRLNNFGSACDRLEKADALAWLDAAAKGTDRYDLIFCDPPSFSNSKSRDESFDVQQDQVRLIEACCRVLSPEGLLLFSCNRRDFKLDPALTERFKIRNITHTTIPEDFKRNPKIHYCFEIRLIAA